LRTSSTVSPATSVQRKSGSPATETSTRGVPSTTIVSATPARGVRKARI